MPRILTMAGYHRMLCPPSSPKYDTRCGFQIAKQVREVSTGRLIGQEVFTVPFYPDGMRDVVSGGQAVVPVLSAKQSWQNFHDAGTYLAFERWLQDAATAAGIEGGGAIKGKQGGPSLPKILGTGFSP
jgi:hypothetical protein